MEPPEDDLRIVAGTTAFPDLMNDPAYDPNNKGKERDFEEPDTCRICRGEGTPEEQLFYPCKCSGSIKFVHQACLVEWLSHSQKKHCELCKTPFHFTKLYDPNMPRSLPTPLFVKQLLIHSFRSLVTWLRLILVAFVWLGWLPWSMRAIWRALFWLADGRWSGSNTPAQNSTQDIVSQLLVNDTISSSPSGTVGSTGTSSAIPHVPSLESSVSSVFSFSSGEPLLLTLMKKALSMLFYPAMSTAPGSMVTGSSNTTTGLYRQRRPSWLSDVKFLNSLTPSPTINNILIDTLEGQLITLLVVISFILIFLIREWVVQQQPMANIGDAEREAAVQLIANRGNQEEAVPHADLHPEHEIQEDGLHDHVEDFSDHADTQPGSPDDMGTTQRAFPRRGGLRFDSADTSAAELLRSHTDPNSESDEESHVDIPESSGNNLAWSGVETFRDLWSRGDGDPERILNIIHDEGREDELSWIVTAMTNLQRNETFRDIPGDNTGSSSDYPPTPVDHSEAAEFNSYGESARSDVPTESLQTSWVAPPVPSTPQPMDNTTTSHRQNDFTRDYADWTSDDDDTHDVGVDTGSSVHTDSPVGQTADISGPVVHPLSDSSHESPQNTVPSHQDNQPEVLPPRRLATRIFDWFFAGIVPEDEQAQDDTEQDDEHLVEDPALEAPFIPIQNNRRLANGGVQEDQGILGEAGIDANDLDAIEDGDDLEGIMELIGMQGPIFGLLQNGVFCALLISFTVAIGIWLPYLWGKIALVLLANPIQLVFGVPMTAVRLVADIALDTLIGSLGYILYWSSLIGSILLSPLRAVISPLMDRILPAQSITSASLSLIDSSSHRLRDVASAFFVFHESDVPMFSVLSHQALKIHQSRISALLQAVYSFHRLILYDFPLRLMKNGISGALDVGYSNADIANALSQGRDFVRDMGDQLLFQSNSIKWFNASAISTNISVDYDLAVWDTKDRVIAIIMGYLLASALGLLYLRITGLFASGDRGQRADGVVADVLNQAGGVMKVILIIGIEMIVFPLYCGTLLDIALLPLFENATISSRLDFTSSSPLTSLFVHWFIGTCYMFHFALFVSMCRKIMRSGVLYFIRDPDDPTFHPVRDVLERNITTQLRKIAFSALVYGALVIVCLGGVVWSLYYAFDSVLPIHWSARVPVLEFPVDLLFYNFLIPLALQSIKPSDVFHNIYNWWFHKCARVLRLTNFFFGDRQPDEEGYHVRHSWWAILTKAKGDVEQPVVGPEQRRIHDDQQHDVYFARDGKYVRAPASDQVRIPKGNKVFLEVSETNERIDGTPDTDNGLHGRSNEMFTKVYVPPHFRSRIAAFILLIWVFAAATGVGTTIIPLVIGRKALSSYFPKRPLNDIYAFSCGMCITGSAACVAVFCYRSFAVLRDRLNPYLRSPRQAFLEIIHAVATALQLVYIGTAFSLVLPSLFALVMELYILVPVHTYLGGTRTHVIHFVQDWTLGVLYVQMAIKFVLWHSNSRPAAALNGIFRDGWLKPNVNLATRAIFLPVVLTAALAVSLPLSVGFAVNSTVFFSALDKHSLVYRYSYPITLLIGLVFWLGYFAHRQVEIWHIHIRDDVYLIGERLHNFREKRTKEVGVSRRVVTR
ncbi:hypothetical protein FE257_011817 [Aspergillus nanangensis]|uniref:RING-type E3 ubiquitin transferase n=1 Tax=Aspergillus nanangensis TaxID=2582783 RepID=A0AAD4CVC4_ASPNN|nr:hypothetical protein FE257_011817 [Aspergillus nanangensis]